MFLVQNVLKKENMSKRTSGMCIAAKYRCTFHNISGVVKFTSIPDCRPTLFMHTGVVQTVLLEVLNSFQNMRVSWCKERGVPVQP